MIRVIPVSIVRQYVEGKEQLTLEGRAGQTIQQLLLELGIPSEVVTGVLVNGQLKGKDYRLQEGDEIKLIPVLGGG